MPLAAEGKLTEVSLLFLPAYGQMYREGQCLVSDRCPGRVELVDQSGEDRYSFSALSCKGSPQIGTIRSRSAALAYHMLYEGMEVQDGANQAAARPGVES